jgi:hypothetical protein
MVLLGNMDEEELLLINAHKFKHYFVWEEQHGKEPTIQEDIRGSDYQINSIAHPNRRPFSQVATYFVGAILLSYFKPLSEIRFNRLATKSPLVLILVMKGLY